MRFKLGYAAGFATGYYLGAKAGRQRYEQLNRSLRKLRCSDTVENIVEKVADKAKGTVAQVLPHRSNGHANAASRVVADGSPNGTATVPAAVGNMAPLAPPPGPSTSVPPYSSSR